MTEISNVKSGTQVINLQPVSARDPVKVGSIDRFSDGGNKNNVTAAGESGPTPSAKATTNLNQGQDPLEQAAQTIDELISDTGTSTKLRIDQDEDTGRFIYKSVDSESGEVVGQFPPESILEIITRFRDPEGLVLDDNA